jgi:hypothetical protein
LWNSCCWHHSLWPSWGLFTWCGIGQPVITLMNRYRWNQLPLSHFCWTSPSLKLLQKRSKVTLVRLSDDPGLGLPWLVKFMFGCARLCWTLQDIRVRQMQIASEVHTHSFRMFFQRFFQMSSILHRAWHPVSGATS